MDPQVKTYVFVIVEKFPAGHEKKSPLGVSGECIVRTRLKANWASQKILFLSIILFV